MRNEAPYEFAAHMRHAQKAGMTEAEIEALRTGDHTNFADRDRLVIDYTDGMTRDVHIAPELFARVEAVFSPEQIVDLTVTIGAYNMVARVLRVLDIA